MIRERQAFTEIEVERSNERIELKIVIESFIKREDDSRLIIDEDIDKFPKIT